MMNILLFDQFLDKTVFVIFLTEFTLFLFLFSAGYSKSNGLLAKLRRAPYLAGDRFLKKNWQYTTFEVESSAGECEKGTPCLVER